MEQEVYRVSEFCRLYALSRSTFYREVSARRLSLVKRGRSSLVTRLEAKRWFDALSNPQRAG